MFSWIYILTVGFLKDFRFLAQNVDFKCRVRCQNSIWNDWEWDVCFYISMSHKCFGLTINADVVCMSCLVAFVYITIGLTNICLHRLCACASFSLKWARSGANDDYKAQTTYESYFRSLLLIFLLFLFFVASAYRLFSHFTLTNSSI